MLQTYTRTDRVRERDRERESNLLPGFVLGLGEGLHADPLEAPEEASSSSSSCSLSPGQPVVRGPPDDLGGRGRGGQRGGATPPVRRGGGRGRGLAERGPVSDVAALVERAHSVRDGPGGRGRGAARRTVGHVDRHFAGAVALDHSCKDREDTFRINWNKNHILKQFYSCLVDILVWDHHNGDQHRSIRMDNTNDSKA